MRIAVVTQPYYPQAGGVSEHVHHTAHEFRKLGHEVDSALSFHGRGAPPDSGLVFFESVISAT